MADALAFALKKVLSSAGTDPEHFLSAFPTQLLFRNKIVKGVAGNATGRTEYVGLALPNVTLTQAKWQIKKLVYDSTGFQTDVLFADGSAEFNKVFDSGASEYANFTYTAT